MEDEKEVFECDDCGAEIEGEDDVCWNCGGNTS